MRSIQTTLLALLVPATAVLAVAAGTALDLAMRHNLVADFDETLRTRAQALRSMTVRGADGSLDFEAGPADAARFADPRAGGVAWFSIHDDAGRLVAGSPGPLVAGDDGGSLGERPVDVTRADGVPARAVAVRFAPELDEDADARARRLAGNAAAPTFGGARLVFAQDRRGLDARLRHVDLSIGATFAMLTAVAAVAAVLAVRRGLRPLRGLAARVGEIDVGADVAPLGEVAGLPAELRPIAARLDELLGRVAEALARERRFTASAAHELRTPIAELRLAAEIALRDPADASLAQRSARQSLDIARQMHATTTALLELARAASADADRVGLEDVPLGDAAVRAIARHASTAAARDVRFDASALNGSAARANRAMVDAVLENLIDNAARYADAGTIVRLTADAPGEGSVRLHVENRATLRAADVERMFEPFWRGDAARTDGAHVGLGLAIVRGYCAAMRGSADATATDGGVRITVRLPAADAGARPDREPGALS